MYVNWKIFMHMKIMWTLIYMYCVHRPLVSQNIDNDTCAWSNNMILRNVLWGLKRFSLHQIVDFKAKIFQFKHETFLQGIYDTDGMMVTTQPRSLHIYDTQVVADCPCYIYSWCMYCNLILYLPVFPNAFIALVVQRMLLSLFTGLYVYDVKAISNMSAT